MTHREDCTQLSSLLASQKPAAVVAEVKNIFHHHYSARAFAPVARCARLVKNLFVGKYPGYRACNTEYHNLTHTMDALLASARIVDGFNIQNPPLPVTVAVNLFCAALLHDTGYIQESGDTEGTGAKYTSTHVERSVNFLQRNRDAFRFDGESIRMITNTIRCTGLSVDLDTIPFKSDAEQYAGCVLGTADILGQMSDRSYLEKLLFLYYEFKEAGIAGFNTEFDLLRKTVDFYQITKNRLTESYMNIHIYSQHYFKHRHGIDTNLYLEAIERQIAYLEKIIEDDSTNFRHKLKRGPWVHEYRRDRDTPSISDNSPL
ncbi:MAG: HD domain-containing protein [Spirochaetes bacterium]|nr:HD domain-containing protein [Spirochaetota bacterium]